MEKQSFFSILPGFFWETLPRAHTFLCGSWENPRLFLGFLGAGECEEHFMCGNTLDLMCLRVHMQRFWRVPSTAFSKLRPRRAWFPITILCWAGCHKHLCFRQSVGFKAMDTSLQKPIPMIFVAGKAKGTVQITRISFSVSHSQLHWTNAKTKTFSPALPFFHAVTKQKSWRQLLPLWELVLSLPVFPRQHSIPLGTSQALLGSALHELDGKKTLQTLKAENLITSKVSLCHYIPIKIIIYHSSLYS